MKNITALLCIIIALLGGVGIGHNIGKALTEKSFQPRVLNEWYMISDSTLHVYRKGYIHLPRSTRDSIRLDAIQKLDPF